MRRELPSVLQARARKGVPCPESSSKADAPASLSLGVASRTVFIMQVASSRTKMFFSLILLVSQTKNPGLHPKTPVSSSQNLARAFVAEQNHGAGRW